MVFYGEFSVDSSIVSIYFNILLLLLPACGSTYASSLGFLLKMFGDRYYQRYKETKSP